jgi:hypothetical protein
MSTGRLPSVDGGIQPTIVDAKGDLIVATAADTVSRLAVGSNDQVLTADSSTSTGLKWATASSGGMTLISTTALSGASTTISNISNAYKGLSIHIYGVTNATADGQFRIAMNSATSITTTRLLTIDGNGGTTGGLAEQNTYLRFNLTTGIPSLLRTSSANYWVIDIPNYSQTTYDKIFYIMGMGLSTTSLKWSVFGFGRIDDAANSISSLVFSNSAGNLSTGTVDIYGVK